jgi:glycosyltransferase involved in cell wall biosynthesis
LTKNDIPLHESKLLIFIVAYEAAETIIPVLERIPSDLPLGPTEILIIDDASNDATFEKSLSFVEEKYKNYPVTILKNPRNQGYGGNQKLGFRYAIEKGFDFIVLLHGDGQYAPESMPSLLIPFENDEIDAVFGSRMLSAFGALRGGMPLYKYFGNKILTFLQNLMLGSNLSEFHSGYRAYRVSALDKIPFETNANVFHFDTEIIIQLLLAKSIIKEVPIPTFYGDEICRVNGLKYAWDIILATFVSRLQAICICYRRQFDLTEMDTKKHYKPKFGFPSSHQSAFEHIKPESAVLDLGCGHGYFAEKLKSDKNCRIIGVDKIDSIQEGIFSPFIKMNLEPTDLDELPQEISLVCLLDLLEELGEPEQFLRQLSARFQTRPNLEFIITTPNVAFILCRLNLLFGRFSYSRRGILDLNHKRLFTLSSIKSTLCENGFEIVDTNSIPPPFRLIFSKYKVLARMGEKLCKPLLYLFPCLFSYQFLIRCKISPTTTTLLYETMKHSKEINNDSKILPV